MERRRTPSFDSGSQERQSEAESGWPRRLCHALCSPVRWYQPGWGGGGRKSRTKNPETCRCSVIATKMQHGETPSLGEAPDAWWEQHSLVRVARRDLDLEWREYAMARVESRTALQLGKRPRERDTSPERRQRPSRECVNSGARRLGASYEFGSQLSASVWASKEVSHVSATPTQWDLLVTPGVAAAQEVSTVQEALGVELVRLLDRLVALAATGCGGCGGCAACLAVRRCNRCEQCNGCYEAASLNEQRQRATLVSVCERIAALEPPNPDAAQQPQAHILPVLHACDGWEAAWEAGISSATFEQQLQVLWERSQVLIGCLDWQSAVMLLPPALQAAATLVPARWHVGRRSL